MRYILILSFFIASSIAIGAPKKSTAKNSEAHKNLQLEKLHNLVFKYRLAPDRPTKAFAALEIQGVASHSVVDLLKDLGEDQKLAAEAMDDSSKIYKEGQTFEASLKPEQIRQIMKKFPQSLTFKSGATPLTHSLKACSGVDFEALRKKVGEETLARQGVNLVLLPSLYESPYIHELKARMVSFIPFISEKEKNRDDVVAYLKFQAKEAIEPGMLTRQKKLIARTEGAMVKGGIPAKKVKAFVLEAALTAPSCLMIPGNDYLEMLKKEQTLLRGNYLLKKIEAYIRQNKDLPDDILAKIKIDSKDPLLYGNRYDGWNRPFILSRNADALFLESSGTDMTKRHNMVVGTLDLQGLAH